MLADFVAKLQRLALDGAPRAIPVPELRRVLIVNAQGEVAEHEMPARQRGGSLADLSDVVGYVQAFGENAEVYVGQDAVRILPDGSDRNEVVTMPLGISDSFSALMKLAKGELMSPRDAVKFLRFNVRAEAGVSRLITALARVDFTSTSEGTNTTKHGQEAYGRTIAAQVQNRDDIPESVDVTVNVFRGPDVSALSEHSVRIGVYLDVDRKGIVLQPLADELTTAHDAAVAAISESLAKSFAAIGDGKPVVFCGTPNLKG